LHNCKVARDQKKIEENKKKAAAAKESNSSGRGGRGRGQGRGSGRGGHGGHGSNRTPEPKWGEPTANEKKNGTERLINGKIHKYNPETKPWSVKEGQRNMANGSTGPTSTIMANTTAQDAEKSATQIAQLTQTMQSFVKQLE
jgi:hypothetical protein